MGEDDDDTTMELQLPLLDRELEQTPVYPIIHMIREDVCYYVDAPLTYEALLGPDLTYSLTVPLQEKYIALQREGNRAIVFAFLINRVHFLRDTSFGTKALSETRAMLCEILAIRTLRENESIMDLALAVTTCWPVFSGASDAIKVAAMDGAGGPDTVNERVGNAIEIAILGRAKRFIKSSACQKVINSIWSGKIVYQAESNHSILSDNYKRNPVHYYDPHRAPLLDHYRLKVPAIRSVLEYVNFLILFVLFVVALELSDPVRLTIAEGLFMLYALGFCLEKLAAMQEHGLRVYVTGTWNGFDMLFVTIFTIYIIMRLYGIYGYHDWARDLGIDCLAILAVLIFPRLAFATLSSNLMVLALRSMVIEFAFLMSLAAFCFAGFLYALWTLVRNNDPSYSAGQIAWWMLNLFFGLDASGFDRADKFHPFFGPVLLVSYACLSNTLLVTVLVSILTHTFSIISEDAAAEAMYRRAVYTIEGVKADAIFSYQPPLNLVALAFMLPSSYILSPRWFHKVNVFMIRLTNFPILIAIALYERQIASSKATTFYETCMDVAENVLDHIPLLKRLGVFEGFFGQGGEIDAIFEIEEEVGRSSAVQIEVEGPSSSLVRVNSSQSVQGQGQTQSQPLASSPPSSRSPLLQLYQGIASGVDVSPGSNDQTDGLLPIMARRRRLSSLGMRQLSPVQPGLTTSARGGVNSVPFARSSDYLDPATVQEVEDEEQATTGELQLAQRLQRVEASQAVIQDLLQQLLRRLPTENAQPSSNGQQ